LQHIEEIERRRYLLANHPIEGKAVPASTEKKLHIIVN
jgi:hypothetical protein